MSESKVFCGKCNLEMKAIHEGGKNGVDVVEVYNNPPAPYRGWASDKLACPRCEHTVYKTPDNRGPFWEVHQTDKPVPKLGENAEPIWETTKQSIEHQPDPPQEWFPMVTLHRADVIDQVEAIYDAKEGDEKNPITESDISDSDMDYIVRKGTDGMMDGYWLGIEHVLDDRGLLKDILDAKELKENDEDA